MAKRKKEPKSVLIMASYTQVAHENRLNQCRNVFNDEDIFDHIQIFTLHGIIYILDLKIVLVLLFLLAVITVITMTSSHLASTIACYSFSPRLLSPIV